MSPSTTADVLLPMLAVDDNTFFLIELIHKHGKPTETLIPVGDLEKLRFYLRDPARGVSAVPRRENGLPGRAGVLWAECESRKQASLLSRLPVPPSVILKAGSRVARTALWWLTEPLEPKLKPGLGWTWGEEANRRLAHALGCPKKHCDASHLVRGEVEFAVPSRFSTREIVGRLAAAPVAQRWAA
jgi:hypothetical protein